MTIDPPPPHPFEAILVIFGRSFLNFFVWKVLENMKNDTTFVRMRSSDHPGDAKMSKRHLALSNLTFLQIAIDENGFRRMKVKVARNEVKNASFAQRSAHRDSRIWRPELIEPAEERKWRARGRRPTCKSAYPDPQILPQCNISSNYPL